MKKTLLSLLVASFLLSLTLTPICTCEYKDGKCITENCTCVLHHHKPHDGGFFLD